MSTMPPLPAPYDNMLALYVPAAQQVLGDALDGIYIGGSIACGAFVPGKSDIDAVAVVKNELTEDQRNALAAMHADLLAHEPAFGMKFEVFYMPKSALPAYDPTHPPRPRWNAGKFYDCWQGHDWVLHRKVLHDHAIALYGPPLADSIQPVTPQQIQQGIAQWLIDSMAPYVRDPARIEDPFFQAYTILTMCRALYTLETGQNIAKQQAAEWALQHWPNHATAIKAAADYHDGKNMDHYDTAIALLVLMTDRARHLVPQAAA